MKKPDLSSTRINKTEMMRKNKKDILFSKQEAEAALQLIHLMNNTHPTCPIANSTKSQHHLHEPTMKIVSELDKFLPVQELYDDNDENKDDDSKCDVRKRKSDGVASCCSSITFDVDPKSDEDAREAVGHTHAKKIKKFRSIFYLYNVTEPL
ncbi:hypothetical protein AgCh_030616 [Apium graveolens]